MINIQEDDKDNHSILIPVFKKTYQAPEIVHLSSSGEHIQGGTNGAGEASGLWES